MKLFFNYLMSDKVFLYDIAFIIRIVIAGICGFLIGYERKNRAKGAGIRTHFIVAASAALMMIVSKYAFFDVIKMGMDFNSVVRLDPSRVAASIVSGVGFLGAGTIFVQKQTVTGLTTAAGIWATAGIGMAIGAGMYVVGIVTTIFIIVAQIFLHSNLLWLQNAKIKNLFVYEVDEEGFRDKAMKLLNRHGISVSKVNVGHNAQTGKRDYTFTLEVSARINEEELIDMFKQYTCKVREKE